MISGRPTTLQIILLDRGVEEARNQLFDDFLADIAREAGLHDAHRRLAGTKPGQADLALNLGDGALGFLLDLRGGNRDLEGMLAAFD